MSGAQGPLSIRGTRESGEDVRSSNVTAVVAVANIVKSSLGPVGLDKMLVDDIGDVTTTNDGATILQMLEVQHPAAKILVELANLQDQEVGDGTTSVVIVAAELLKRAHELVKNKIHPTSIISGYRRAMKEAVKFVEGTMAISTDSLGEEVLLHCAKTAMSSKIIGAQEDFFSRLVVDTIRSVKTVNDIGDVKYPVKAVNVLTAHGKSLMESQLIKGYALNMGRAAQGMPMRVQGAKIACVDFNLQKQRMHMGVQVRRASPPAPFCPFYAVVLLLLLILHEHALTFHRYLTLPLASRSGGRSVLLRVFSPRARAMIALREQRRPQASAPCPDVARCACRYK